MWRAWWRTRYCIAMDIALRLRHLCTSSLFLSSSKETRWFPVASKGTAAVSSPEFEEDARFFWNARWRLPPAIVVNIFLFLFRRRRSLTEKVSPLPGSFSEWIPKLYREEETKKFRQPWLVNANTSWWIVKKLASSIASSVKFHSLAIRHRSGTFFLFTFGLLTLLMGPRTARTSLEIYLLRVFSFWVGFPILYQFE